MASNTKPDSVEVEGILWLAERDLPFREQATDAILDYFIAELPETARMANCGGVVDFITTDAENEPPEGVYTHYETQCSFLVDVGLLQVHEDENWQEENGEGDQEPIKVYSLTEQAMLIYKSTRRKDGHRA